MNLPRFPVIILDMKNLVEENERLKEALRKIMAVLDVENSNILMDAAYGIARGNLEESENEGN